MNAYMRAVVEAERHLAGVRLPRTARLTGAEMLATAERCERERFGGSPPPSSFDLATNGQEITGIASAHGSVAFGERGPTVFAPTAFDASLARSTAYPLLWQHIDSLPIGTAHLAMTPAGLHLRGVVADSTQGRDALAVARVGGLSGISIGFIPYDVKKTKHPVHGEVRIVGRAELMEVSLVTYPADGQARIASVGGQPAPRYVHAADLERFERCAFDLRTSGVSRDMFGRLITPKAAESHRAQRLADHIRRWNTRPAIGSSPSVTSPFIREDLRRAIEAAEAAVDR